MKTKPAKEIVRGDVISLCYKVPDRPTATTSQSAIVLEAQPTKTGEDIVAKISATNGGKLICSWERDEEVTLGEW